MRTREREEGKRQTEYDHKKEEREGRRKEGGERSRLAVVNT